LGATPKFRLGRVSVCPSRRLHAFGRWAAGCPSAEESSATSRRCETFGRGRVRYTQISRQAPLSSRATMSSTESVRSIDRVLCIFLSQSITAQSAPRRQ